MLNNWITRKKVGDIVRHFDFVSGKLIVMENNVWRIRYNEELNTLLKGEKCKKVKLSQCLTN
jgi:hypothetical protein